MTQIYVDADGCPVKDEVYRVAHRCGLGVTVVSNKPFRIPPRDWITRQIVGGELDAADDWIAEQAGEQDIVVTSDIPLADRCIKAGARVLTPRGRILDPTSIGDALATRNFMTSMRESGVVTGGAPPFQPRDRSTFLQKLDELVNAIKRERARSE